MAKLIFFACVLLVGTISFSQSEKNVQALQQLQERYNSENYQGIYDMLSDSFQQKVPEATLHQLFSTFQKNFGKFNSFEFVDGNEGRDNFLATFHNGQQSVGIYVDGDDKISGLLFKPVENDAPAKFERNTTKLQLPFKGEWFTFWGGTTKMQNYHVTTRVQKGAFDFIIVGKNGRSYERSGTRNEDYYAFGQPLYAVCDATVAQVITGVEDNRPTIMNPSQPLGNSVMLRTKNGEYIVYAHLEKGSLAVKEGDVVTKGQYLGNCGNSGNSSEAHLHLHIQDGPNMMTAGGARCYFEEVMVGDELRTDYSPVRLDRISRPNN